MKTKIFKTILFTWLIVWSTIFLARMLKNSFSFLRLEFLQYEGFTQDFINLFIN